MTSPFKVVCDEISALIRSNAIKALNRTVGKEETTISQVHLTDMAGLNIALARLMPHCTIDQLRVAFGNPASWNYSTPIVQAIIKLYAPEPTSAEEGGAS